MKSKKLLLTLFTFICASTSTFASIGFNEPFIVSPRFSIKPAFNTGEGGVTVSPRFSIKPAFNSGLTKYFYSGVISFLDMPETFFKVDGKEITTSVKISEDSTFSVAADYSESTHKDTISKAYFYVENVKAETTTPKTEITVTDYKFDVNVPLSLTEGFTYKIVNLVEFNDGMKYEVKSNEFRLNKDGVIEFISPRGHILHEKYITARYEIGNALPVNTYNLYIEKEDGTRVLVGKNLNAENTKVSNGE